MDRDRKTLPAADDGRSRDRRDESSKGDRRENREADKDVGRWRQGTSKDERKDEGGGRAARDTEPDDSSGRDEQARAR